MEQNIPRAILPLTGMGSISMHGLELFEEAVGVKLNTRAAVEADVTAARTAQNECKAAKAAREEATATLAATNAKVGTLIMLARDVLKPKLGTRYSVPWNPVGFVNNTLQVPYSSNARLGVLKSMQLYFLAHPEAESPGVVTAEMIAQMQETYLTAITAANIAATTSREKLAVRDAAAKALEARIRGLFQELRQLLRRDDPRWLEFGFKVPADVSVPAAPEQVAVAPRLAGELAVSWEKSVNADYCRVFCQVMDEDEEPVAVKITAETSIQLKDLKPGARVKVYVTAVNGAGESPPSEIVATIVP